MYEYEVVCDPRYAKMFAIMKKAQGFWQQVGHRYTYKKNAEKAVERYKVIDQMKALKKAQA